MENKISLNLKAKKENEKNSQGLFRLSRNKCVKEHLILSLRTEIHHYKTANHRYNQSHENVALLRNKLENNGKRLETYCDDIKDKLKDFAAQVERYEQKIEKYKKDTQQIIVSNEAIIKQKMNDKTELEHQYDILNSKIKIQMKQLKELEYKQNKLASIRQEDNNKYLESEKAAKQKYSGLYNQYNLLASKYEEYKQEKEKDKTEAKLARGITKVADICPEEMQIKLIEIKIKNDVLQQETESLMEKVMNESINNQKSKQDSHIFDRSLCSKKTTYNFILTTQPQTTAFTTQK